MFEEIDFLEMQKEREHLFDDFISNNNISSFKKLLNSRITPKEKKPMLLNSQKLKRSDLYLRNNIHHHQFNCRTPYSIYQTLDTNYDKYKIDRHDFFNNDLKENKLKGNYKWASQKFQLMKINWAKRKGIPIEQFQVPKKSFEMKRGNSKEIDGNTIRKGDSVILPKIGV